VLGDEAQPATSEGSPARATSGPRHAAPRKSLLTKLHVPAGKAVALAAMPTAVLMGMGLTPHLAQADPLPKNPFKPGPCVTQSDTPTPSSTDGAKDGKDGKDASKGTAKPTPTTSPSAGASDQPDPTAGPSTSKSGDPVGKALPKTTKSPAAPTPSPTADPTKTIDPQDPLGLGNLLGGLLGGGSNTDPSPSPTTASPKPDPTTTTPKPDPSPTASGSSSSGGSSSKDGKDAKDALKEATKALKGATATPTPSASGTASTAQSTGSATDGSQAYPCPTYDAKALADAKTEGGIPLLPDEPWTLKSSKLTLHGLNYEGIVQVRTYSGAVKDVLKFTTTGIDIGDLDQLVVGPHGTHTEVKAAAGSTSTIRNGTTTLYTESLSGNLLGLVPVTFTPKAPPPLTLPELFFTDVTVINAGQFGGDLHIPGMQVLPNQP